MHPLFTIMRPYFMWAITLVLLTNPHVPPKGAGIAIQVCTVYVCEKGRLGKSGTRHLQLIGVGQTPIGAFGELGFLCN